MRRSGSLGQRARDRAICLTEIEASSLLGDGPEDAEKRFEMATAGVRDARPGPADTAWSCRDAVWGAVFAGVDPDPENVDAIRRWSIDYFDALHPYSAGGAYVNVPAGCQACRSRLRRGAALPRPLLSAVQSKRLV